MGFRVEGFRAYEQSCMFSMFLCRVCRFVSLTALVVGWLVFHRGPVVVLGGLALQSSCCALVLLILCFVVTFFFIFMLLLYLVLSIYDVWLRC